MGNPPPVHQTLIQRCNIVGAFQENRVLNGFVFVLRFFRQYQPSCKIKLARDQNASLIDNIIDEQISLSGLIRRITFAINRDIAQLERPTTR